jgi:dienelactone hydrolase
MRRYLLALLLLAVPAVAAAPAAAKVRTGPAGNAFYTPPSPIPAAKHGDVIWARKLTGPAVLPAAKSNRLVLYRSVGSDGKPIAVSGIVSIPRGKAPRRGWPVITYAHGTTGVADACAPSLDSTSATVRNANAYIRPLLTRWLKAGYAVVRTDYQGLATPGVHEYLDGREEGRSVLDMARAARKLDRHLGKRVAISGHSQGGHAALWAAALAPSYTRELKVRGTVAFAPASHLQEQAALIPEISTPLGGLGGFAALALRAIDVEHPELGLPGGLTDRAAALYPLTLTDCLAQLAAPDSWGGLAGSEYFRSGYDRSGLLAAIGAGDPDDLRIRTPVVIEQGTGDGTVLPGFTQQLYKDYKQRGNNVTLKTYPGVTHGGIVTSAAKDASRRLRKWLKR